MPKKRSPRYKQGKIRVKGKYGQLIRRPQILVKDFKGRFVKLKDRYSDKVAKVLAWRGRQYKAVFIRSEGVGPLTPKTLVNLLMNDEYETLPEAVQKYDELKPKGKYQAWDIGVQLSRRRGIRGKLMKLILHLKDGKRMRKVITYTRISKGPIGVNIWGAINRAVGASGFYLYDRFAGKLLVDRRGKKVVIDKVIMQEVM